MKISPLSFLAIVCVNGGEDNIGAIDICRIDQKTRKKDQDSALAAIYHETSRELL